MLSSKIKKIFKNIFGALSLLLINLPALASSDEIVVRYPISTTQDTRLEYFTSLLSLVLSETGKKFSLQPVGNMNNARRKVELEKGTLSIIWTAASQNLEQRLTPIKIPIYGGIMGYRVLLTHRSLVSKIDDVRSADDFKEFRFGQGTGWLSTEILRESGYKVFEAPYENLFKLVDNQRIDLYPRGIQEFSKELELRSKTYNNLTISKVVGIKHPIAVLFYVNKNDHILHAALSEGLDKIYKNGKFEGHFKNSSVIQKMLQEVDFSKMRWIDLPVSHTPSYITKFTDEYYELFSFRDLKTQDVHNNR